MCLANFNNVNSSWLPDTKDGTLCFKLNGSNDVSVGLNWEQNISEDSDQEYPHYVGNKFP